MTASLYLRQETAADIAGIREVTRRAFGREVEAELVEAIRASPQFLPTLSLVTRMGDAVVGHALLSRITVETGAAGLPGLALGPVAVLPECQGQGIGSTLIRAGLERARAGGEHVVVVVGHPTYYPRFGFAPARARGLEVPFPVGDGAFMALDLASAPGCLPPVRGIVRYPPAWGIAT